MKIDEALGTRIERAEAHGLWSAMEHGLAAFPNRNLTLERIAGATVAYAGADSPFTQVTGLGIEAQPSEAELDAILTFYRSRSSPVRVTLSPIAGEELPRRLIERGFTLVEYENALAADLTRLDGGRDPRIEICEDAQAWADASSRGFTGGPSPPEDLRFVSLLMASHPEVAALALRERCEIVATGCLALEEDGIAAFFATSTLPDSRERGCQTALVADRIARAKEGGATIARATAHPGTASERNFRRAGFAVLYTRGIWRLD